MKVLFSTVVISVAAILALLVLGGDQSASLSANAIPTRQSVVLPATAAVATVVPKSAGSWLLVPSSAIDNGRGVWTIPDLQPTETVRFFRGALPSEGWKIDEKTSRFTKMSTGDWVVNFCRPSTQAFRGLWRSVVIREESHGSRIEFVFLPDDDPC